MAARRPGDPEGAFVRMVPAGRAALQLAHPDNGTVVTLIPERSYSRSGSIRSLSFSQVPDVTIRIERPGKAPVLLQLDPKYKLDSDGEGPMETDVRPKKVDNDKMHAYRDAIRDETGQHVVTAACTIYPGPSVSYGPWIQAIQGNPADYETLELQLFNQIHRLMEDP